MSIASDIEDGIFCQECGQHIDGDDPGYPRSCSDCEDES